MQLEHLNDEKDIRRAIVRAITAMWLLFLAALSSAASGHHVKLQPRNDRSVSVTWLGGEGGYSHLPAMKGLYCAWRA